jgi:hypothetical protein
MEDNLITVAHDKNNPRLLIESCGLTKKDVEKWDWNRSFCNHSKFNNRYYCDDLSCSQCNLSRINKNKNKKWLLNAFDKDEKLKFEEGYWYIIKDNTENLKYKALRYDTGKNFIGFNTADQWKEFDIKARDVDYIGYKFEKASLDEVKSILLEYAKEKYPIGTQFRTYILKNLVTVKNNHRISGDIIEIKVDTNEQVKFLFYNNKWAEIINEEQPKPYTGKFKIGDKVKVIRKAEKGENDWICSWVDSMNYLIGNTVKIYAIATKGYFIDCGKETWHVPEFILESIENIEIFPKEKLKKQLCKIINNQQLKEISFSEIFEKKDNTVNQIKMEPIVPIIINL